MELKTSYASDNYPIIVKHHAINSLERYIKNEEQRFFIIDKQVYNLFVDKLEALVQALHQSAEDTMLAKEGAHE